MRILALRHFSFDDEYALASWAAQEQHQLSVHDATTGVPIALLDDFDLLVICGGPMSVYEDHKFTWLAEEKQLVRKAMTAGKYVLGICFGAQMLAELLGSTVFRNVYKEIGWHSIIRTEESHRWLSGMPEQFVSFQWHGDTFMLPQEARLLAYSEACAVQAFAYGERVLGLQFHLETTPACMEEMLQRWSSELVEEPYIHSAVHIRSEAERHIQSIAWLHGILNEINQQFLSQKGQLQGNLYTTET